MKSSRKIWLALGVLAAALLVFVWIWAGPGRTLFTDPRALTDWLQQWGAWIPLLTISLHIVQGRQMEVDLRTATRLKSLTGEPIDVEYRDAGSRVGNAHIVKHDIVCSNGAIHIVDALLFREYAYSG